jgi:manganese oxidase
MGGMFTVIKVREGLARNDYKDPGWYKHPEATVAREWTGRPMVAERAHAEPAAAEAPLKTVKPAGHAGHH